MESAASVDSERPEPSVLVLFGASGDLVRRKLIPALYRLCRDGRLPEPFAVVGVSRRDWDDARFCEEMRIALYKAEGGGESGAAGGAEGSGGKGAVAVESDCWQHLEASMSYAQCDLNDIASYAVLKEKLDEVVGASGVENPVRIHYLSVSPDFFVPIVDGLEASGVVTGPGGRDRIVVEKPFGRDASSAAALNERLRCAFDEEQIYRVDHYLGKETVQNILVLRFGNAIFEPIWNRHYIDHVQITVAEQLGMEGRGGYYERSGAVRDMFQNHLMQLLALTAMEPPAAFSAGAIRDEKAKLLLSLRPFDGPRGPGGSERVVRAQYTAGNVRGEESLGYLEEPNVDQGSRTETFAALRVEIDNWRWKGVPFFLRSGKRMPTKVSEIAVQFHLPPQLVFPQAAADAFRPNLLALRLQPNEAISLRFQAKAPGPDINMHPVQLYFDYDGAFQQQELADAYVWLLHDCMGGDSTLFTRGDTVRLAWELLDPVLSGWRADTTSPMPTYQAGSWGPPEADALMTRGGRLWRRPPVDDPTPAR